MDVSERSVDDRGGIKHQQREKSSQSHRAEDGMEEGERDPASLLQNENSLFKLHLQNIYIFIYKV